MDPLELEPGHGNTDGFNFRGPVPIASLSKFNALLIKSIWLNKTSAGMKKAIKGGAICGGCKVLCYCSTVCAKESWPFHKKYCKILRKGRKDSMKSANNNPQCEDGDKKN